MPPTCPKSSADQQQAFALILEHAGTASAGVDGKITSLSVGRSSQSRPQRLDELLHILHKAGRPLFGETRLDQFEHTVLLGILEPSMEVSGDPVPETIATPIFGGAIVPEWNRSLQ